MLYGRDLERARLAALTEGARRGRAGVLLVRGEPGVGKSALLDDLTGSAADQSVRVLRTQGLESESPLAFGALHRLLRPLTPHINQLPAPQAQALRVAFGQQAGPSVTPFLVGVATLSMLTEAAEQSPLLCVIDDAHWLDTASADALLFAARRLEADRVAIVFAARDTGAPTFTAEGIETLTVSGLGLAAVRSLLTQHVGDGLTDAVAQRLWDETGGNPLALVELPAKLTPAQLNGAAPLPARLTMSTGVERVFLDRVRRLPQPVQALMLVVAADDTGQVATTMRAAASLGANRPAWGEAEKSGLLFVEGDTVRVRHPLVRSAVYQGATSLERRHAHRAIADALAVAGGDPDREAWHRAAAAEGWDEAVAENLTRVAARAESRGGYAGAAAAYERAAELSPAEPRRAALLYAAARNAWESGEASRAANLCSDARERTVDPVLRADIDRLRGRIEVNVGSPTAAHRIFTQAARAVADIDPVRALEMAVAETVMHNYGVHSGASLEVDAIRVEVDQDDTPRVRCLKQLLNAMTLTAGGNWSDARAALQEALLTGLEVTDLDLLGNLGNAALHLGDEQAAQRFYTVMLSAARESGAGMSVVYALQRLAFTHFLAGQWAEVRAAAEEALSLSRSVGQQALTAAPLAWLTLLAALQDRPEYDALLSDLEDVVAGHPLGILTDPVHDLTRWAKAVRATRAGDPPAAVHHLARLRLPTLIHMAAMDRLEAAYRAGDPARVDAWSKELSAFAAATEWPWALGAVAYGRALTAETADDTADNFEHAVAHHRPQLPDRDEGTPVTGSRPYDRARVHLAYGEWLRRHQRRVDARTHLRTALETFNDLHAAPLVARATEELRASGETARRRDPSTLLLLTPTELKVAQLVSSGLSNRDVAAQCWISPRTVAYHLRNVFAKTGVTSRGELAQLSLR